MFDGRFRTTIERGVRPAGDALRNAGITADHLTATGVTVAVAAAAAIGAGALELGVVLLALSALPDLLDGAVAKASGTASVRGAFFDSVADRVTDVAAPRRRGVVPGVHGVRTRTSPSCPWPCWPRRCWCPTSGPRRSRSGSPPRAASWSGPSGSRARRSACCSRRSSSRCCGCCSCLTLFTAGQRFVKVWRQAAAPGPPVPPARWRTRRVARPASRTWRRRSRLRRR